jgi:hypothetical protein
VLRTGLSFGLSEWEERTSARASEWEERKSVRASESVGSLVRSQRGAAVEKERK